MHFPELSFLRGGNGGFPGLQTTLVNFGQWEMPEIESHFSFIFFHDFFNDLMRPGTILVFVFSEFHQGYRSRFRTYKYVPGLNDLDDFFLKSHDLYSFWFFNSCFLFFTITAIDSES